MMSPLDDPEILKMLSLVEVVISRIALENPVPRVVYPVMLGSLIDGVVMLGVVNDPVVTVGLVIVGVVRVGFMS